MPFITIAAIALVTAAASAVNGFVGASFLFIIWIWLYGGVIPMIYPYLKQQPQYTWAPQLLLPLILFLIIWQIRLRGKIGPRWGLMDVIRGALARRRRSDTSYA